MDITQFQPRVVTDVAEPVALHRFRPVEQRPIGVFGSGAGGLYVADAIARRMPEEAILCLCDHRHHPYGSRSTSEARELTLRSLDWLVAAGVKAVVIACNTASAVALFDARERYQVPILNVITPAVRAAGQVSRSRRIGVLATPRTLEAGAFPDTFAAMSDVVLDAVVVPRTGPVARRRTDATDAARSLAGIVAAGCDTVILGCTHLLATH